MPGFLAAMRPDLPQSTPPQQISELDCLHGVLPPDVLRWAEERSRRLNCGADQVLISHGLIDEDRYLDHLARHCGLVREDFTQAGRSDCPLADEALAEAAERGVVPLRDERGALLWVIAPRHLTARGLCQYAKRHPDHSRRIRIASSDTLQRFLLEQAPQAMAQHAADDLHRRWPHLSAASDLGRIKRLLRAAALSSVLATAIWFATDWISAALTSLFIVCVTARLVVCGLARPIFRIPPRMPEAALPSYTVLVALYKEASSVAPLVAAIEALDYPPEKLDIIFAVEANDLETRAAIARLGAKPRLQTIIAPVYGPQTKPKALNFALPFVRGTLLAVFDAEDRPEPGQLRAAVDALRVDDIACAQASLCIDNPGDHWLAATFSAEYAGQFDLFMQGLSRLGTPLPLGGSSNHFRTAALRRAGGWDAYNVTEDADLGIRLARFGYHTAMFASTTYEEAPTRFGVWLRQRSRWMKGWMQTWLVHMRSPWRLKREAGWRGLFTLNLIVGGNVLTALAHPFLLGGIAIDLAIRLAGLPSGFWSGRFAAAHITAIVMGYAFGGFIGFAGLARRGLLRFSPVLLLAPIYWVCLSIAAWRALWQLIVEPHRWEKTEHGLARSAVFSRRLGRARAPAIKSSA